MLLDYVRSSIISSMLMLFQLLAQLCIIVLTCHYFAQVEIIMKVRMKAISKIPPFVFFILY